MKKYDNYYIFENCIKNAFFVKDYDFNTIRDLNDLEVEYDKVKKILDIDKIATVKQEHTSLIKKVTLDNYNEIEVADGMITNVKGIGLATKVADCQAILLYDPVKEVIGNVHSGWKGTIKKIVSNAINIMLNDYDCDVKNIKVFISPSIGGCHFEVDEDVYLQFKEAFTEFDIDKYVEYKEDINKYYIDTKNLNRDYMISLGIDSNNIEISNICTVCEGDTIHSYRVDKEKSGRNLAVISL